MLNSKIINKIMKAISVLIILCTVAACNPPKTKTNMNKIYTNGTFKYDLNFINKYAKPLVLSENHGSAMIMIIPGWQARVMTSTASGDGGFSYGWLNYKLIASGKPAKHINAFGGEERLWLGPEGGPFSLYFRPGVKQEYSNWQVPSVLDTVAFDLFKQTPTVASFTKSCNLKNFSGNDFSIKIDREIKLLTRREAEHSLGIDLKNELSFVAYQTKNSISNQGKTQWTEKTGALSVWMLSMFNPSSGVTIFIPYNQDIASGIVVNDDYFGKVPPDRLIVKDGIIWFKADGRLRSKIGITSDRAKNLYGSYDAIHNVLTIIWCELHTGNTKYVNSKWGSQSDPFSGDVINSYNDGPLEDGSQLGPFYELESSSPAAFLKPGESLTHTQRIFHFEGNEDLISDITQKLFGLSVHQIKNVFAIIKR